MKWNHNGFRKGLSWAGTVLFSVVLGIVLVGAVVSQSPVTLITYGTTPTAGGNASRMVQTSAAGNRLIESTLTFHAVGLMATVDNSYSLGTLEGSRFRHAHLAGTLHASALVLRNITNDRLLRLNTANTAVASLLSDDGTNTTVTSGILTTTGNVTITSSDGARFHTSGSVHAQTGFSLGGHVVAVANNAVALSANVEVLTGGRSLYLIDCNDPDGCTIQFGTTAVSAAVLPGAVTILISITTSANTLSVSDLASVQHVAGAFTMGESDNITLILTGNRSGATIWREISRSDN
jgi:hypothetical protein